MKSITQMLAQCEGLLGTKDVNAWENSFLRSCIAQEKKAGSFSLSAAQVECVEKIWGKHFA